MKTTLPICCSVFLIAGAAWGQDSMTLEQFNTLVAAPGDTNALRAELASLPFWKVAKCSSAFKLSDGRVFTEESVATTKTIGGKYIVCSMDSQYLRESLRAVIVYDEKASALKSWGDCRRQSCSEHGCFVSRKEAHRIVRRTWRIYGDFRRDLFGNGVLLTIVGV